MLLESIFKPLQVSYGTAAKSKFSDELSDAPTLQPKTSRQRFQDRSLRIVNPFPSRDPMIQCILEGDVAAIDKSFFPKQANEQTALMRKIIRALILFDQNPRDRVRFIINDKEGIYQFEFKGKKYELFSFLAKIKWDLIKLDLRELDEYEKKSRLYSYSVNCSTIPSIHHKHHLYEKLHNAEKMAIAVYKTSGVKLNRFLRKQSYSLTEKTAAEYLIHTAVLCSALNKIPPSVNGYLYRCVSDAPGSSKDTPGQESLVGGIARKLKVGEKFKELGFTSMSMFKPLEGFGNDCVKIYTNPYRLARDISGIAGYESEFECLFLPNTKDLALREIVEEKPSVSQVTSRVYRYVITKIVSKRQGLF